MIESDGAPNTGFIQRSQIAGHALLGVTLRTVGVFAGLLAQQDSITPSLSVVLSVLISLLGNVVFVAWLHFGLMGAGWTTVITQWVHLLAGAAPASAAEVAPHLRSQCLPAFWAMFGHRSPFNAASHLLLPHSVTQ